MAKSNRKKVSTKNKFKPTMNRSFLALVTVLLFASVAAIVIGLKLSSAARVNYTYTVRNGDYDICLKYRVNEPSWRVKMNASSTSGNSNSVVSLQQTSSTVPNPTTQTKCPGRLKVRNGAINVTLGSKNASILDFQCKQSGRDKCGPSNRH